VVSLHSKGCWSKDSPDPNAFGRSGHICAAKVESFHHLFEVLLVYETWFRLDEVDKTTIVGSDQVNKATKYAMTRYVNTVDRTEGNGLKTTKTHAPLHTEYNLQKFGSNNNSHSGPCKSNHIENVKKPAKNTQCQKDTIDNQLCKRLSEKMVLDLATGLVDEAEACQHNGTNISPSYIANQSTPSATRFAIDIINKSHNRVADKDMLTLTFRWLSSHKKDHPSVYPEMAAGRHLFDLLIDAVDGNTSHIDKVSFSFFTEHKRGDQIYRSHPNYRNTGPWYDWAYVEYGPNDTGNQGNLFPSQIWYFVDLWQPIEISDEYGEGVEDIRPNLKGYNGEGLYAIVTPTAKPPVPMITSNTRCTGQMTASQKAERQICTTSLILKTAFHDKALWLVPVESISSPAMVIDHPGMASHKKNLLIVVTPRMEWLDKFLSLRLALIILALQIVYQSCHCRCHIILKHYTCSHNLPWHFLYLIVINWVTLTSTIISHSYLGTLS